MNTVDRESNSGEKIYYFLSGGQGHGGLEMALRIVRNYLDNIRGGWNMIEFAGTTSNSWLKMTETFNEFSRADRLRIKPMISRYTTHFSER